MGRLFKVYLSSNRIWSCNNCSTHLADHEVIISTVSAMFFHPVFYHTFRFVSSLALALSFPMFLFSCTVVRFSLPARCLAAHGRVHCTHVFTMYTNLYPYGVVFYSCLFATNVPFAMCFMQFIPYRPFKDTMGEHIYSAMREWMCKTYPTSLVFACALTQWQQYHHHQRVRNGNTQMDMLLTCGICNMYDDVHCFIEWMSCVNSVNVSIGKQEERSLRTGRHVVADIKCTVCGSTLGWKYVSFHAICRE